MLFNSNYTYTNIEKILKILIILPGDHNVNITEQCEICIRYKQPQTNILNDEHYRTHTLFDTITHTLLILALLLIQPLSLQKLPEFQPILLRLPSNENGIRNSGKEKY